MSLVLAATVTRVAIDVSLAFVAFFVGFFAATLFTKHAGGGRQPAPAKTVPPPKNSQQ
jgi:hypothetical protein